MLGEWPNQASIYPFLLFAHQLVYFHPSHPFSIRPSIHLASKHLTTRCRNSAPQHFRTARVSVKCAWLDLIASAKRNTQWFHRYEGKLSPMSKAAQKEGEKSFPLSGSSFILFRHLSLPLHAHRASGAKILMPTLTKIFHQLFNDHPAPVEIPSLDWWSSEHEIVT